MTAQLDELRQAGDSRVAFHAAYLRTTRAIADAVAAGAFLDADWPGRPDEGGPDEGGPDEGGPDEGGPDEGGPDEGGPDEGGPDEGGPDEGGRAGGRAPGGGPGRPASSPPRGRARYGRSTRCWSGGWNAPCGWPTTGAAGRSSSC